MKGGLSHVEMIISFVIFAAAISFALYFFSPTRTSNLADTSLDYIEREVSDNVSVGLKTYSIKINDTNNQIGEILALKIDGSCNNENDKVRVENLSRAVFPSKTGPGGSGCSSNNREIIFVKNAYWDEDDFIYLKLSEDFDPSGDPNEINGNVGDLNEDYYTILSSDTKTLFSEKRLLKLNGSYYEDYFGLKEQFNLPGRVNFAFSVFFDDLIIEAEKEIPSGLDIYSKTERMEILRANGEVEYADFVIKVW